MRRHLTLATLVAMAGCGKDGPDDDFPNGPGRYDAPADFDRSGCGAGVFDGVDPQGIYHFVADYGDGFPSTSGARLDDPGDGTFGGAIAGADADLAWASDDERFLHRVVEYLPDRLGSRSLLLCNRDGDEVTGQYAFCNPDECFLATVRGKTVERLAEADASGLTELGRFAGDWTGGVGLNVRVDGDVAYMVRGNDGLRIIDIADPAAPAELAHVPVTPPGAEPVTGEIYNDVKLVDGPGGRRVALLASSRRGVVPVDVTDPGVPIRGTPFGRAGESVTNVHTLAVDGGRAYLSDRELGLEIWDVADPLAPTYLGGFVGPDVEGAFLHDLYVEGARAYLNFWAGGMVIADVTDPASPVEVGGFAGYGETSSHSSWVTTVGARRIAAHGDEQWGARLRLVDVDEASPTFEQQVGVWQTRPEVSIHNVMAFDGEVVMSHYQDGVRIVDISDPANPRTTAWFNTWPGYGPTYGYNFFEGAVGVDVDRVRNRIYVADSHRGLFILQR